MVAYELSMGVSQYLPYQHFIPTGIPLVYELDKELRPIKHYYLGDSTAVAQATKAVADQGKAR